MTQQEFLDLLRKYRQGTCSSREKQIIEDWFKAISTDQSPFPEGDEESHVKKRLWRSVDQHIASEFANAARKRNKTAFLRWPVGAVAATVLVLLVAFVYFERTPFHVSSFGLPADPLQASVKTVVNEGDGPRKLVLPDGSRIRLLSRSKVTFSAAFQEKKREVYLDGEAFFDVAHDSNRPFLVYTNALTTEVLGTSFSIKAYRGQKEIVVTVQTGKVSVYKNATDASQAARNGKVILTPNQQIVFSTDEQLSRRKLVSDPQVILPQPTLKHSYTNAPVIDILFSLEENYGIDIRYDAKVLSHCTLTSDMSEEGFYEQITIICNALGAQYTIEDSVVIINATGCMPLNIIP